MNEDKVIQNSGAIPDMQVDPNILRDQFYKVVEVLGTSAKWRQEQLIHVPGKPCIAFSSEQFTKILLSYVGFLHDRSVRFENALALEKKRTIDFLTDCANSCENNMEGADASEFAKWEGGMVCLQEVIQQLKDAFAASLT